MQVNQCPMCGASVAPRARTCEYCDAVLINIGATPNKTQKISDDSFTRWRNTIKEDPDNPEAQYSMGLLYLNRGLHKEAANHLRIAAKLAAENPLVHYNLAIALFNDSEIIVNGPDYNEMMASIHQCLKIDPGFSEAKAFLHLFEALNSDNYALNMTHYENAIKLCPDVPLFYNNHTIACAMNDKFEDGEKSLKKVLQLAPGYKYTPRAASLLYSRWMSSLAGFKNLKVTQEDSLARLEIGRRAVKTFDSFDGLNLDAATKEEIALVYSLCSFWLGKIGHYKEENEYVSIAVKLAPDNEGYRNHYKGLNNTKLYLVGMLLFVIVGVFMLFDPSLKVKAGGILSIIFFGSGSYLFAKRVFSKE